MKSLEELKRIRDIQSKKMSMRDQKVGCRIVVGMATCGITAGARPVLNALVEEVSKRDLVEVSVTQVGCIGECALEPIVEIYDVSGTRTTYCKVKESDAAKIIEEHVIAGNIIEDLLLANHKI